jgi:hypothetical protein
MIRVEDRTVATRRVPDKADLLCQRCHAGYSRQGATEAYGVAMRFQGPEGHAGRAILKISHRRHDRGLAETRGFEPPVPISKYNALAKRRLQPLGHVSRLGQEQSTRIEAGAGVGKDRPRGHAVNARQVVCAGAADWKPAAFESCRWFSPHDRRLHPTSAIEGPDPQARLPGCLQNIPQRKSQARVTPQKSARHGASKSCIMRGNGRARDDRRSFGGWFGL